MSEALVVQDASSTVAVVIGGVTIALPRLVVDAGPPAVDRFLEFFAGGKRSFARARRATGEEADGG